MHSGRICKQNTCIFYCAQNRYKETLRFVETTCKKGPSRSGRIIVVWPRLVLPETWKIALCDPQATSVPSRPAKRLEFLYLSTFCSWVGVRWKKFTVLKRFLTVHQARIGICNGSSSCVWIFTTRVRYWKSRSCLLFMRGCRSWRYCLYELDKLICMNNKTTFIPRASIGGILIYFIICPFCLCLL